MRELMSHGGPGMWPILILGVVGLATAGWFAWRAEGRVVGFVDRLGRSIVCATLVALAMDIMATLFHAPRAPVEDRTLLVMRGLGESMSPLVLGFALLCLINLLMAIGQRRLDGKA